MTANSVSLDGLSVSDLTALQAQIDKKIKEKIVERRISVKNQILALLNESGFSIAELFPATGESNETRSPSRKNVRIKYSDGQRHWTGRGRTPLWIKAFLESGGDLASLEVKG